MYQNCLSISSEDLFNCTTCQLVPSRKSQAKKQKPEHRKMSANYGLAALSNYAQPTPPRRASCREPAPSASLKRKSNLDMKLRNFVSIQSSILSRFRNSILRFSEAEIRQLFWHFREETSEMQRWESSKWNDRITVFTLTLALCAEQTENANLEQLTKQETLRFQEWKVTSSDKLSAV